MLEEDIKPNKKEYKFLNLAYNRFFELTDKQVPPVIRKTTVPRPSELLSCAGADRFSKFSGYFL